MRRVVVLAVSLALWATGAAAEDRSQFAQDENAQLYAVRSAATEDERLAARRALARFYAGKALHVETIAALGDAGDDEARLMRGAAELALLRNEAALATLADERLADDPDAAAMRAVALGRLGAFEAARHEFSRAGEPAPAAATEFLALKAEAMLAGGDVSGARAALTEAEDAAGGRTPETGLVSAAIAAASGDPGVRAAYRDLAASGDPRVAALAALRRLAIDLKAGAISRERARRELAALRFKWSGGAFERERLQVAAAAEKDVAGRIVLLGRLARTHPRSDAAAGAKAELQTALRTLLDDQSRDARQVASVFLANAEFAPHGAEGDVMVRALAERLRRLDLLKEAAALLEHQTFKRLRGAERALVAADLAALHLEDRRPAEALRVLRATRFAGLDAATVERRRVLEATALERSGDAEAALQLLAEARGEALDARAGIAWRAGRWAEAAASYRALLEGVAPPLSAKQREALLRAGAAYVLAKDDASFAAYRTEAAQRFGGFPESELLDFMNLDGGAAGANFMNVYRTLFPKS